MVATGLAVTHSLFRRDLVEALPFEIKLAQAPVTAPGGRFVGQRVRRTQPLHQLEQKLFQRRPTTGWWQGRSQQIRERVNLK